MSLSQLTCQVKRQLDPQLFQGSQCMVVHRIASYSGAQLGQEMKAIIQRVIKASVTVDNETVGSIGRGLCVLVGISHHDTEKEMEYIVRKILNIRLFSDESDKRWMKSVMDMGYEVLCISQFTLEARLKGNKPDFSDAMAPGAAQLFYNQFLEALKTQYKPDKIQDGKFAAYMQVHIQNDGPVTIPLEIKPKREDGDKGNKKKEASSPNAKPGATNKES
ncbi:unnamed protein product [Lymnaea stagnalis]|uniref:D-aminoacyl-tRNA deacylase n=1 Tax=Lymnaea stagnalis TaxID=6523 RepID=A0AAV2HA11_LYMST